MESQKKLTNPEATGTHSEKATEESKRNEQGVNSGSRLAARPGTNDRKAASEDIRHLNAEQDEAQLRKDEEARRTHKSP